jgi:hypothetical protein
LSKLFPFADRKQKTYDERFFCAKLIQLDNLSLGKAAMSFVEKLESLYKAELQEPFGENLLDEVLKNKDLLSFVHEDSLATCASLFNATMQKALNKHKEIVLG